jgi:hypothetical protein
MSSLRQIAYWRFLVLIVLGALLFLFCTLISQKSIKGPAWRPLSDPKRFDVVNASAEDTEHAQVFPSSLVLIYRYRQHLEVLEKRRSLKSSVI